MRPKISVIILTRSLSDSHMTLSSIGRLSDDVIILIDGKGKDKITSQTRYIYHELNEDFATHRQYAQKLAKHKLVLFLDDDEYLSQSLQSEILAHVQTSSHNSACKLRRIDVVLGQRLLHGEQGKMYLVRLVARDKHIWTRSVHEKVEIVDEVIHTFLNPLYHLKDRFISEFIASMTLYTQIDAACLTKERKPFSYFRLLVYPIAKFARNYFILSGFLDGYAGLFYSYLLAVQSFTVRIVQWSQR